ncbi:MAG TPA: hypothetical protein VHZ03_30680 [Trebonia sp.]|jgi:hypothetical protein|nr:hypothetical protein [Trebonia sp.]
MPERDQRGGWQHPGWSWTVRNDRLIPSAYWVSGLLAAFALGNVPALVTADWKSGTTWVSLWLSAAATVIAVLAFGLAETARRGRDRMIISNGTAYIIQEQARFWDDDQASRFRAGIDRQFARVIQVPGPVEADRSWDWSLDSDARLWDAKADELVRAFRVLSINAARNGTDGPNAVFLWAYWPVAAAFGMRVTAADRALALDVWQRPSHARAGEVDPAIWSQRPLRFLPASGAGAGGLKSSEHIWPASIELSRIASTGRGARRTAAARKISVLLLRFSSSSWGPLPAVPESAPPDPLTLSLRFAASDLAQGTFPADIHELRCVPPNSPSGTQFPWSAFPALAAKASTWIEHKAKELDGQALLLGTLVPQEVGLGLGILAGQESRRASWPDHLWPIVRDAREGGLVIPHLNLGKAVLAPSGPA